MSEKYTLRSCREYTMKLIELVKAGKEIDMTQTNSYYGRFYTIVVKDESQETSTDAATSAVVVNEAVVKTVSEDKVSETTKEQVPQEEADEAKKPVGRKSSKK